MPESVFMSIVHGPGIQQPVVIVDAALSLQKLPERPVEHSRPGDVLHNATCRHTPVLAERRKFHGSKIRLHSGPHPVLPKSSAVVLRQQTSWSESCRDRTYGTYLASARRVFVCLYMDYCSAFCIFRILICSLSRFCGIAAME